MFTRLGRIFQRTEKFFEDMGKQMTDMSEQMEKDFEEVEDQLDEDLKGIRPGEEKKTVVEETRPDGTHVVTTTIIRKTS